MGTSNDPSSSHLTTHMLTLNRDGNDDQGLSSEEPNVQMSSSFFDRLRGALQPTATTEADEEAPHYTSLADTNSPTRPGPNDILQQDVSYFFRNGEEEQRHHRHKTLFRLRAIPPACGAYADARDILTGPSVWHKYLTKYEELNQEIDYTNQHHHHNFDLQLHEAPLEIRRVQTWQQSSLLFQQDGRKLMLLPQDSVRLLMDPDLEPGVLAVEQTRTKEQQPESQQLQYVLTVPDDLYRRLVTEMSNALIAPYCGFSACCSDTQKTDIRIAIFILAFTLSILLFLTLFWVTE